MGKRKKEVVFSYRIIQKEKSQKIIYGRYTELLWKYRSADGRSQKDKRSLKKGSVFLYRPVVGCSTDRLLNFTSPIFSKNIRPFASLIT